MRRSPARLLLLGFLVLFALMLIGSSPAAEAQADFPTDFVNDGRLYVYCAFDGENVKDAKEGSPININLEGPMTLSLQINATGSQNMNMSGQIVFYYQGIAIFPIQIVDPVTNSTWIWVVPSIAIDPIVASIDLSQAFTYQGVKIVTGILQASVDFKYYLEGSAALNEVKQDFYFNIPFTPQDVFTSVTGISTTAATIGAVYGVGTGFQAIIEGLKTAYKLRGIHKKASEIRSLPNLTVIGALPLLFSMLAGMGKMKRKKKDEEEEELREDSAVSEYIVRQKLREVAPDAWPEDKCPQCLKKWNKKKDMCTKCKIGPDEARQQYAEILSEKVPRAIRAVGKKKSIDIRGLAKKTKSTDYNAGVLAAAMVDTGVTEIVKVGTPLKSFVMNIAGLAFLIITWQQLLGDSASTWQTTITLVGAALSLAVIVALYVTRKTQIEKFEAEIADVEGPPEPAISEVDQESEEDDEQTEEADQELEPEALEDEETPGEEVEIDSEYTSEADDDEVDLEVADDEDLPDFQEESDASGQDEEPLSDYAESEYDNEGADKSD